MADSCSKFRFQAAPNPQVSYVAVKDMAKSKQCREKDSDSRAILSRIHHWPHSPAFHRRRIGLKESDAIMCMRLSALLIYLLLSLCVCVSLSSLIGHNPEFGPKWG